MEYIYTQWYMYIYIYAHNVYIHIYIHMKVRVQVAQSCLTLCDPMDYTVHGILQARIWSG